MRKFYAGIGSRETPVTVLQEMTRIASSLRASGYLLRSGHADGADQAFETGAGHPYSQIMLPWEGYNQAYTWQHPCFFIGASPEAEEIAANYHPAWENCSQGARKLHARNVSIMGGLKLNEQVDFVVCWTRDGRTTGGTGQALRIAEAAEIPVFNLYRQDTKARLVEHIRERQP